MLQFSLIATQLVHSQKIFSFISRNWVSFRPMISPSLHVSPSPLHCFKPPRPPSYIELKSSFPHLIGPKQKRFSYRTCRAHFSDDAPFVLAIGACMLSSLVLPISDGPEKDGDSALDSTDTRFAVMGIISVIPYFNWLSWIFAWLDTGKRRYAVYSLVYLAPYLRSNLSLSLEESWLPIASILYGIIHVQLEAGIRNGDIQGFQAFREIANKLSSFTEKKGYLDDDDHGDERSKR